MKHSEKAVELFLSGYNCAQAVSMAFCDCTKQEERLTAALASPFGGGMGRMREVCGAFSGMLMVLGILYGYDDPAAKEEKKQLYIEVQTLANKFRTEAGSIICRDILKNPSSDPTPAARTDEYYAKRPCARIVALAAKLLDEFIEAHPFTM